MKKLYSRLLPLLIGPLLFVGIARGQEVDYTQYYLNLPGINPAFAGMDDYLSLKLGYRQGWNGFGVNNNNVFISAYGALGVANDVYLRKNSLRVSDMEAMEKLQPGKRIRRRQGIGGMATSRMVGPYTSTIISGDYAYHLPVSEQLSISLGTRIAYANQRIDYNGYTVRDPVNDAFLQQLQQSNPGNISSATADFGSAVYTDRFYLGISTGNLAVKSLSGDRLVHVNTARQYALQAGIVFPMGPALSLNTGVRLTQAEGYGLMWSTNGRIRFKDIVYLGAGYASNSKMSGLFGVAVRGNFTINYAYDHYFAGVGALNVNVHEVVLGLAAFNRLDSRARVW